MPVWKLIHILVRWSLLVVAEEDGDAGNIRLPVLSQLQLGRFMSRSDARTCLDLAMDILKSMPGRDSFTDAQIEATMISIRRQSEASDGRKNTGYLRKNDSSVVARALLGAVERQVRLPYDREMFWAVCRTTTWAQATRMLSGRDWISVRDDFRRFCDVLWTGEAIAVSQAIEQMFRVMEQRRRARA